MYVQYAVFRLIEPFGVQCRMHKGSKCLCPLVQLFLDNKPVEVIPLVHKEMYTKTSTLALIVIVRTLEITYMLLTRNWLNKRW